LIAHHVVRAEIDNPKIKSKIKKPTETTKSRETTKSMLFGTQKKSTVTTEKKSIKKTTVIGYEISAGTTEVIDNDKLKIAEALGKTKSLETTTWSFESTSDQPKVNIENIGSRSTSSETATTEEKPATSLGDGTPMPSSSKITRKVTLMKSIVTKKSGFTTRKLLKFIDPIEETSANTTADDSITSTIVKKSSYKIATSRKPNAAKVSTSTIESTKKKQI